MANVLDFKCDSYPEDLLRDIFDHQHKLAEKYIPIEKSNGLCLYDQLPADLDNARAQARIKDMSWRAIEEVAEAFEALDLGEVVHFYEEMADALHFLIEKYLLCNFLPICRLQATEYFIGPREYPEKTNLGNFFGGYTRMDALESQKDIDERRCSLDLRMAEFVKSCGLTCNCLKNKPWKQSQMLTDKAKFRRNLMLEFKAFISLCAAAGFSERSLYDMYIRKNQVNQFRQRTNY